MRRYFKLVGSESFSARNPVTNKMVSLKRGEVVDSSTPMEGSFFDSKKQFVECNSEGIPLRNIKRSPDEKITSKKVWRYNKDGKLVKVR